MYTHTASSRIDHFQKHFYPTRAKAWRLARKPKPQVQNNDASKVEIFGVLSSFCSPLMGLRDFVLGILHTTCPPSEGDSTPFHVQAPMGLRTCGSQATLWGLSRSLDFRLPRPMAGFLSASLSLVSCSSSSSTVGTSLNFTSDVAIQTAVTPKAQKPQGLNLIAQAWPTED